ncbi:hypothetical protein [Xenococcus sp. PCC 7305]|uniref:hypothetical protein n=1 Tax=Xenococcus sp. PCC 7305 TaxID=102125 RepID=UPI0002F19E53|nr:hypothetical protein [Xenococcus sp. PCC 7305]
MFTDTPEARKRLANFLERLKGDKTYRAFAQDLGVSFNSLHSWINMVNFPQTQNLQVIALYSGQSVENLLHYLNTGEEEAPAKSSSVKSIEAILSEMNSLSESELLDLVGILIDKYLSSDSISKLGAIALNKLSKSSGELIGSKKS